MKDKEARRSPRSMINSDYEFLAYFSFFFYTGRTTQHVGSSFPDRELNSSPRLSERRILATGPPGKSQTPILKRAGKPQPRHPHRSTHHASESVVEREDGGAGGSTTREGSAVRT